MKITQVTPGVIPIPPNGWGAVEKIIWNYKLNFDDLGHECDIQYLDYVDEKSDIIHIHIANLALMAKERGIPYIFSLHDHHVFRFGKDSKGYQDNLEAIKGSVISFTHAEFLVDFFDETDKLFYLSHGVDTDYFTPIERDVTEHKLLCVANNGYGDNPYYDRKGFRYAIEAAKELDLPITIVGPENNLKFFSINEDLLEYEKLTLLSHNATEEELLDIMRNHTIFLHPSELEAGHPNLTILESISCGVPVVGTYSGSKIIKALRKIERNTESVVDGILDVINNYEKYKSNTDIDRKEFSWSVICKRMEKMFESVCIIQKEYSSEVTKNEYINSIETTVKNHIEPKDSLTIISHFVNGAYVEILNSIDREYLVEFYNGNNELIYSSVLRSNMWTRPNIMYYVDWRIKITCDGSVVYDEKINLKNQRVYIGMDSSALGDNLAWIPYIEEFRKKHDCHVICSTFKNDFFESQYPEIEFVTPGSEVDNLRAMYLLGWFYDLNREPTLPNVPSLQEHACNILGLEYKEIIPKISTKIGDRPIEGKYVTIANESTSGLKFWSNPNGWTELVNYLKNNGYDVINVSKNGEEIDGVKMLDDTSLENTINTIHHSEFFIGLSSGLSWLSWAIGKHVVMISNFSEDKHEFTTNCTRIVNKSVCNSCWNNPNFKFDKGDWYWCPINKGTENQFICQKSITSNMVINQIQHLL
jgi:autotransporter strand-loop-strand O-heptosyltransferase